MRTSLRKLSRHVWVVAGLFALACGGKGTQPSAQAPAAPADLTPAAIVEGADFVASFDVQAIRSTPACKDFAKETEKTEAAGQEEKGGKKSKKGLRFEEFARVTGLTAEDMRSVVVSADVDAVDFSAGEAERLSKAKGVLGVGLAKPVSSAKLTEALKAAAAKHEAAQVLEVQAGGHPAVQLKSGDTKEPDLYVASGPGDRTLFVAGNLPSLEGALERAGNGKFVEVPAALKSVRDTLPASSQFRLAFLAPAKLQASIKEQLDKAAKDPDAAMWSGMVAPFKDLQSLGLGVECGAGLTIGLGADLGNAQAANQLVGMLQGMALPMIESGLARKLKKTPAEVADRFEVSAEGSALKIQVRLTAEDVTALHAAAAAKEAAAEK